MELLQLVRYDFLLDRLFYFKLFYLKKGASSMNFPPHNADTTVNNVKNPDIFVIYHDAQAYPEYLLTYE